MYRFKFVCKISKDTFEISHKFSNPDTSKYALYETLKFIFTNCDILEIVSLSVRLTTIQYIPLNMQRFRSFLFYCGHIIRSCRYDIFTHILQGCSLLHHATERWGLSNQMAIRLFVQEIVWVNDKKLSTDRIMGTLWGESTGDRWWIPLIQFQWKRFHVWKSSYLCSCSI